MFDAKIFIIRWPMTQQFRICATKSKYISKNFNRLQLDDDCCYAELLEESRFDSVFDLQKRVNEVREFIAENQTWE